MDDREPVGRSADGSARGPWRAVAAGLVLLLALASVPAIVALTGGDTEQSVGVDDEAKGVVLAALASTIDAGSYDMRSEFHVEPGPPDASRCQEMRLPDGVTQCVSMSRPAFGSSSTGTVNIAPYAMAVVTNTTSLGEIRLFVDDTTVWQTGGGNYGAGTGAPLSGFASLVEGTLGPGAGGFTMLGLATRSGYLALDAAAVAGATPAGTGVVDGVEVTYYDVTVDAIDLAATPDLSDDQRVAVERAVRLMQEAGYESTQDRVGVDGDGFIREVTSVTTFADGTVITRYTVLSNFGCARRVTMPNQPPSDAAAGTCPPVTTTTTTPATTAVPGTSSTSTSTTTTTTTTTTIVPSTSTPTTAPASSTPLVPSSTTTG